MSAIQYFYGEHEQSHRLMLDFFGRCPHEAELCQLCGVPDAGELYIGYIGRSLYFEFYETARWGITGAGAISRHQNTLILRRYNYFFLRQLPGYQDFGSQMLTHQAAICRHLGIRLISEKTA